MMPNRVLSSTAPSVITNVTCKAWMTFGSLKAVITGWKPLASAFCTMVTIGASSSTAIYSRAMPKISS